MVNEKLYELDRKALETILRFKPDSKFQRSVSDELLRLKDNVKRAVTFLSKEEQEIFEFKYFYGLTEEEIAGKLNLPKEKVISVLFNSTGKIKHLISVGFPKEKKKSQEVLPSENVEGTKEVKSIVFANKVIGLLIFAFNISLLIALLIGSYFLLQRFVFSEMPSLKQVFSQAGNVVQQEVDKNEVLSKIAGNKNYFAVNDPLNLRISGSTSLLTVSRRWENAFNVEFPKYKLSLVASDSDAGIESLLQGKIDIANSSRPLTFLDHKKASEQGIALADYRVAIDALVIAVNKQNPIDEISLEELKGIFNGSIKRWNKIGSFSHEVLPVAREGGSGTNSFLRNRVLEGENIAKSVTRIKSNQEIIRLVGENIGAISCVNSNNFGLDNKNIKYLKVKSYEGSLAVSPFEGRNLNENAIRYGDYPLAHYLYLITLKDPPDKVKDFVNWILTSQGQKIVRYSGLIPVYNS